MARRQKSAKNILLRSAQLLDEKAAEVRRKYHRPEDPRRATCASFYEEHQTWVPVCGGVNEISADLRTMLTLVAKSKAYRDIGTTHCGVSSRKALTARYFLI